MVILGHAWPPRRSHEGDLEVRRNVLLGVVLDELDTWNSCVGRARDEGDIENIPKCDEGSHDEFDNP